MDTTITWTVVLGIIATGAAIVTWFMRLESRLNGMLSLERHEEICEKTHKMFKESLTEIRDLALSAHSDRGKMGDELTDIKIKLAVLISQRNSK